MISKRVFIAPANDHYARLAAYIADAGANSKQNGEKCLMSWCAGMLGGDDYQEGIAEAQDVQARNIRAASKTYHLVISFRPEDEAKLTPEIFKAIEGRFSAALGYTDHQRHCGVHTNTGNLHMHVAYNMIHPETYTCHKEFRDFWIRDKVCRSLEHEFGMVMDNGIEQGAPDQPRRNEKARLAEVHTGQQSFDSYAKSHKEALLPALEAAVSWLEMHAALASRGMEIKPHGNGLVVKDIHGKSAIKASALDRSLSLKKLETRFGPYVPPQNMEQVQEHSRYQAAPLHRSPERGQLFTEYSAGIEARKTRLRDIKEQEEATLAAIRAEWTAKRRELERKNIAKKNLRNLLTLARKHEAEALARARLTFQEPRSEVRREVPFFSWNGFLQHKAEQGNEVALAVLRSLKETVQPEQAPEATQEQCKDTTPPVKDWSRHGLDYTTNAAVKADFASQQRAMLEREDLSGKGKTRLLAVLRMEEIADDFQHHVDSKGAVVFTFQNGVHIRDNGRDILFSARSESARETALLYARKKWGKQIHLDANKIVRHEIQQRAQTIER